MRAMRRRLRHVACSKRGEGLSIHSIQNRVEIPEHDFRHLQIRQWRDALQQFVEGLVGIGGHTRRKEVWCVSSTLSLTQIWGGAVRDSPPTRRAVRPILLPHRCRDNVGPLFPLNDDNTPHGSIPEAPGV